jgi:hypothetical protein
MLYFLIPVMFQNRLQLRILGSFRTLVVPIEGLKFLDQRNDSAMDVDRCGLQLIRRFMQRS